MAINVEDVRKVQWSFTHNWDIIFPSKLDNLDSVLTDLSSEATKSLLLNWFPATSVNFPLFDSQSKTFEIGGFGTKLPTTQGVRGLKINFMDDENAIIERWIEDWVRSTIQNKGKGISYLADCCKLVIIRKLNSMKIDVKPYVFWIYPDNTLPVELDSEGKVQLFSQDFVIAGDLSDYQE